MPPIRANTVLPADRRPLTLTTADGLRAGGGAGPAAGSPCAGDVDLPAPAAHARRLDGQSPAAQDGVAAACAGRPRGAAVQHPRHRERGGSLRGRLRRRRERALRPRRGRRIRRVPRAAVAVAGGLVVRHRPDPAPRRRSRRLRRGPAEPAAALLHATPTSMRGRASVGPSPRSSPSSTTTCSPPRPVAGSPASRRPRVVAVEGAHHLFVGRTEEALDAVVAAVLGTPPMPRLYPRIPGDLMSAAI